MKELILVLLLVASCSAVPDKPPFREGIEYRYEWEARVESQSFISNDHTSSAHLRGHLFVVAKQEDSHFKALVKLRNVSLALNHGERVDKSGSFIELQHLNEQFSKPFYIFYSGSKIAGASFPDDVEQIWSVNFKRSIATLLQFELSKDQHVYTSKELSLFGNCGVQYFTTQSQDNQLTVQKDRDLSSCPKKQGRWRTFIQTSSCPGSDKQPLLGTSNSVKYSLNVNRGHPEMFRVESLGNVILDPFGVQKSSMKSKTTFAMFLEKTKRSTENLSSKVSINDYLAFSFKKSESAPSSLTDLKAAQNLMLHPEPLINDQETLRRKTQLDLIAAVESLSSDSYSSDDRISVDKLALSAVSYQLGSLDYANARALYKELSIAPNNEKLHSAKNLLLDLLLHSGSNPGIILLRDLIREQSLDAFTAARLVAYAGAYAKVPTEKLVLEFQSVVDAQLPGKSDELGVYKNAAILSLANLIGAACSENVCKLVKIEEARKTYLDVVTNGANSYADRALNFHALKNLGFGSYLDAILDLSTKTSPLDDEPANDLRIYFINSLSNYKNQQKVANTLIRILRDPSNSFRARVAAVQALLDDVTDDKIVDLMGTVLSSETNNQVKHYITSALMTIASSKNPCTSPFQGKAKHVLHSVYGANLPGQSSSNSAEYAFDFFENEASFGSQLNLRTTTSEFDDLFGFVSGKMLYFIKGVAVQPFSFTVRTSGLRKYLSSFFSSSLKKEDLHSFRTQSSMDDFNFAPRKELGSGADVAFNLHGSTVMFYHFDKKFLQYAIGSARSLEILQDLNVNLQRYATTGALLYTHPNSLGLPVSVVMSAPILISLKGSVSKLKTPVGRRINLSFYGEIYGDHGLLTHLTPVNITQGVVRNRKAFFNIPLNLEISGDIQKMQFDFTFVNPKVTNPIELSSFARTILTIRPSESSHVIFRQACSQCRPVVIVQKKGASLKTETIANLTLLYTGTDAHAQVFKCDGDRSVGKQLSLVASALNPATINYRGFSSAWAYMSFIRLQHLTFIQPDGRHCGFRGRVHRSVHLPVKEMSCRLTIKSTSGNDEPEISWQNGKIAFKVECSWKGETANSDRKGEVDFTYEWRNAAARNSVNVRAIAFKSPILGYIKDVMICLKADGNFMASPTDMIDISGYSHPPNAQGNIDYVMGEVNQVNQCPTDQFRLKVNIKASADISVMQRRDEAKQYPYKECKAEKKNWAPGITPQTDACYKAALDFTTLTDYHFDFKLASIPVQLQRIMGKLSDLMSLSLLPYLSSEEGTPSVVKDITQAQLNFTFLPDQPEESPAFNLDWSVNNVVQRYNQIALPGKVILPSTSIPQSSRIAYEGDIIPSCLVTSRYIRTLDKVQFNNTFSPCYSLVTTDCGSNPLFGVFVRKIDGAYPLAVKVQVGGHSIEVIPDETGRRKQFTVRANELEVDAHSNAYSLPEGREKFYVIKVRYQAPIYVISSPGAGLLVHYSGSHVAVFPTWLHKNQHCGLCGNFDGETDGEWLSPQGCELNDAKQLIASYTMGQTCYSNQEKNACPEGNF